MRLIAALLLTLAAGAAAAQEGPAISGIRFAGNAVLDDAALSAVAAPWLGRPVDAGSLVGLQKALQDAYERAGYRMVAVGLPREVGADGVVRIVIREIPLGKVTVKGGNDEAVAIRAALPALREGEPLRFDQLARQLALANDNPSRQMSVAFSRDKEAADAVVSVQATDPVRWGLGLDNTGTAALGRSRAQLLFMNSNLWQLGHVVTASLGISLEKPNAMRQAGFSYTAPLPAWGDAVQLLASYSDANSGRVANAFDVSGQGTVLGVRYQRKLAQDERARHVLEFGYDEKRYRNTIDFAGTNLGVDVTAKPVSLAYRYSGRSEATVWQAAAVYAQNMPGGDNNDDATYGRSRAGADAHWDVWRLQAGLQRVLAGDWRIGIEAEGQYTHTPLISGEQFGLGGVRSVRGFEERAVAGDRGWRTSLEVTTPEIAGGHRFLAFIDAGGYARLNPQPGEPSRDAVASWGVGWRLAMKNGPAVSADLGVVANGTPQVAAGSVKGHVALQWWF